MPHCGEHEDHIKQVTKNTTKIEEHDDHLYRVDTKMVALETNQKITNDTVNKWRWMTIGIGLCLGSISSTLGFVFLLVKIGVL